MAETTFKVGSCPTCGSKRLKLVRRNWKDSFKGEPYTVPDLEFHECPNCGERLYDREAMRKIERYSPAYSKSRTQKKSA